MGKFLVSLKSLEKWYNRQKRVLPWRNEPTVYRVWISEIMLQQTQVVTVIPYFERFMSRFPKLEDLAQAAEEEVLKYWAGLGYYSRARNLHRAAKIIDQNKKFPVSREEWLEIPGVGNYTAGAILSISSNQVEAILDGNVERVLSRVRRCNRQKGDLNFKSRLWKLSRIFVTSANQNKIKPSVLNQALMELGATVCTPRNPKCEVCPLNQLCRAYEKGDVEAFPPKKKPKKWVHIEENLHCLIHSQKGRVLLEKKSQGEWRAGLWDLPKRDPQQIYKPSLLRHIGQVETQHIVTQHKIRRNTQVWELEASQAKPLLKAADSGLNQAELRWISMNDPEVAVGSALKKTLNRILVTQGLKFRDEV